MWNTLLWFQVICDWQKDSNSKLNEAVSKPGTASKFMRAGIWAYFQIFKPQAIYLTYATTSFYGEIFGVIECTVPLIEVNNVGEVIGVSVSWLDFRSKEVLCRGFEIYPGFSFGKKSMIWVANPRIWIRECKFRTAGWPLLKYGFKVDSYSFVWNLGINGLNQFLPIIIGIGLDMRV